MSEIKKVEDLTQEEYDEFLYKLAVKATSDAGDKADILNGMRKFFFARCAMEAMGRSRRQIAKTFDKSEADATAYNLVCDVGNMEYALRVAHAQECESCKAELEEDDAEFKKAIIAVGGNPDDYFESDEETGQETNETETETKRLH